MKIYLTKDKKMKAMKLKSDIRRGFVLLFTLLISSILLATGLGISRLMVREISLAALGRESQVAFFVADTGMECAMHWNNHNVFDPSSNPSSSQTIYCDSLPIKGGNSTNPKLMHLPDGYDNMDCDKGPTVANVINGGSKSCFTASVTFTGSKTACFFVVVDNSVSQIDSITGVTKYSSKITSNGYNTCDLTVPNSIQRTLFLEASHAGQTSTAI